MYSPCFNCLNRYGHSYTEECDNTCEYAHEISQLKRLKKYGSIDYIINVMKGDEFPLVFVDKEHIDFTYRIVCAAKDGVINVKK